MKNSGWCPVCESDASFVSLDPWLRDHYRCETCHTIPRERALFSVLQERVPGWRALRVHESSPGLPSSAKLQRECPGYVASQYFPDVPCGSVHNGFRCENLERQTFEDGAFDIVITQDVMEHVLDPMAAFSEIGRTLTSGGVHVFTTPLYKLPSSRVRARLRGGEIEYLEKAQYHGNPIDPRGALVTIDYGYDIADLIYRASGLTTTLYNIRDEGQGILGEFRDVLVSLKGRPGPSVGV